jgi:tRNA (mo5U34)-methyltransferase
MNKKLTVHNKENWFHYFQLKDGTFTNSINKDKNRNECMDVWGWKREFFKDKRILDIGSCDGLHSLIAEEFGAKEVIAIDRIERENMHFTINHFDLKVKYYIMDICDRDKILKLGKFDTVIFCGVFYHLFNPISAVLNIKDILNYKGNLLFETLSIPNRKEMMSFIPETCTLAPSDYTNWWLPSDSFLISFFRQIGFTLENGFGYGKGPYSTRWHCSMTKISV